MIRSWITRVWVLLFTILLVLSLFLGWTNLNYNTQVRNTIIRENTNSAATWSSTVELQLNTLYEHVYDLLLTIYNNTELGKGTPMMRVETKTRCLDMMSDKLIASKKASCFFVRDSSSDLFLFSAKSGIPNQEASALKAFARGNSKELSTVLDSKKWHIAEVDGQPYFVKIVALGKYVVGTASRISYYDIQHSLPVLGEEVSCMLATEDTVYHCSGKNWESDLRFVDGEPVFPDERYAVCVPFAPANAKVILAVRSNTLLENTSNSSTALLMLSSMVCLGLIVYLLFFLNLQVLQPTGVLLKANQEIGSGNIHYRIDESARSTEFAELYASFNSMASQIQNLRIESYDHLLQDQENRLRMLRAQIKPHFYLNAITTINNMTYQNEPETVRAYIAGLAKYLRYMLNTQSEWTTIEDELAHIHNYLQMQQLRFPGSIQECLHCDPEVARVRIPLLTLFTLVENSFKHAMTLYEPLKIVISCEPFETEGFRGARIIEEDSGGGFPPEVLEMMAKETPPALTKEHLGLSNVCYTLNLTYHRSDLLHISNLESGGAHVEIWIPEEEGHDEAADL